MLQHIDLFSGYGGFAYAFREVFGDEGRTVLFCDNDKYCQGVLKKHWPEVPIWGDIRELIAYSNTKGRQSWMQTENCFQGSQQPFAHAKRSRPVHRGTEVEPAERRQQALGELEPGIHSPLLLTGGFPCQPFSQAGKRRGKSDDRFLWPEMLECIRLFQPSWVIAENVHGILSIEGGLVFEQVCSDMEKEGYEVWPFIIPACAVNAPHRRDRVWIVGYSKECGQPSERLRSRKEQKNTCNGITDKHENRDAPITTGEGLEREIHKEGQGSRFDRENWQRDWREVAFATCVYGVDDGTPLWMDGVRISEAKHRTERLRMCGNGIVPQVAEGIMKAIRSAEEAGE